MADLVANKKVRTRGLPVASPVIFETNDFEKLKSSDGYLRAKSGDMTAAITLVQKTVSNDSLCKAKEVFCNAMFVPVWAVDEEGTTNMLPLALAAHYSVMMSGSLAAGIVQTNRAYHTGARAMERLLYRAEFEGSVKVGGRYVIVDDVTTMGGTIADMANFIQTNGGQVIGTVLLANCSRHGIVNEENKYTQKILGEKYDHEIRCMFGIEPSALTRDEAKYLIGFKSVDEMRNRAVAARSDRADRLASKNNVSDAESRIKESSAYCELFEQVVDSEDDYVTNGVPVF